ncbi:MAG: ATP phosphoribosyltransferase regulatory subunit [Porticoccaceae bacterium]|nr:MAG: ATP phosphoribosyltransferase regulatory subunit [Porticoccaceae bacterium]
MGSDDRWLLPDGIEELLPERARRVELLRRALLDLFDRFGYELVIPPPLEFADSLGALGGRDLEPLTFKVTDQLSGRLLALRPDFTPQTARMDAHSLRREGPTRLCYAGSVLYARPRDPFGSRCPIHAGVELYGEPGLEADLEVLCLLVEALRAVGVEELYLDLGHVGVLRALEGALDLCNDARAELCELLAAKSCELSPWLAARVADSRLAGWLAALPELSGGPETVARARALLAGAPPAVGRALDEIEAVLARLAEAFPGLAVYVDLGELESYHYHTGLVFAAYSPAAHRPLGNGGRYDGIGAHFGRARPATGFTLDLKALIDLIPAGPARGAIYAPPSGDPRLREYVRALRERGERVVQGMPGAPADPRALGCDRVVVARGDGFALEAVERGD